MSYTTINDLQEKLIDEIYGSEYLLLTDQDNSYKVSVDTISEVLISLTSDIEQTLKNKIIDDVTNFVHANAIHFVATAKEDIVKGQPVKLITDPSFPETVFVGLAGANDVALGICEDGCLQGEQGEFMVSGILTDINTTQWTAGDFLYAIDGALTTVQPTADKIQFVGYVLNSAPSGKILVSGTDPYPDARQILFDNNGTDLTSTNVQDAITEVDSRMTTMEEIVFQQATAPTAAQGASDGDIWMDTTTNTLNVYREYPIGTGVYRWEPLLYKWDDTVDGGSW